MTELLKPCPLCGAPARYSDGGLETYIECDGDVTVCGIRMHQNYRENKDGLIVRWNALPRKCEPRDFIMFGSKLFPHTKEGEMPVVIDFNPGAGK